MLEIGGWRQGLFRRTSPSSLRGERLCVAQYSLSLRSAAVRFQLRNSRLSYQRCVRTVCNLAGNGLQVVFVSTEVAPYSKTGGLGDVMSALPAALASRGHRVMTVSPRYKQYHAARDTGVFAPVRLPDADAAAQQPPHADDALQRWLQDDERRRSREGASTTSLSDNGDDSCQRWTSSNGSREIGSVQRSGVRVGSAVQAATYAKGSLSCMEGPAGLVEHAAAQPIASAASHITYVRFFACNEGGVDHVFVDHPLFGVRPDDGTDQPFNDVYTYCPGGAEDIQARNSLLCQAALAAPVLLWLDEDFARPARSRVQQLSVSGGGWALIHGLAQPLAAPAAATMPLQPWAQGKLLHASASAAGPPATAGSASHVTAQSQVVHTQHTQQLAELHQPDQRGAASEARPRQAPPCTSSHTGSTAAGQPPSTAAAGLYSASPVPAGGPPIIFVGNDWHTGLLPLWMQVYFDMDETQQRTLGIGGRQASSANLHLSSGQLPNKPPAAGQAEGSHSAVSLQQQKQQQQQQAALQRLQLAEDQQRLQPRLLQQMDSVQDTCGEGAGEGAAGRRSSKPVSPDPDSSPHRPAGTDAPKPAHVVAAASGSSTFLPAPPSCMEAADGGPALAPLCLLQSVAGSSANMGRDKHRDHAVLHTLTVPCKDASARADGAGAPAPVAGSSNVGSAFATGAAPSDSTTNVNAPVSKDGVAAAAVPAGQEAVPPSISLGIQSKGAEALSAMRLEPAGLPETGGVSTASTSNINTVAAATSTFSTADRAMPAQLGGAWTTMRGVPGEFCGGAGEGETRLDAVVCTTSGGDTAHHLPAAGPCPITPPPSSRQGRAGAAAGQHPRVVPVSESSRAAPSLQQQQPLLPPASLTCPPPFGSTSAQISQSGSAKPPAASPGRPADLQTVSDFAVAMGAGAVDAAAAAAAATGPASPAAMAVGSTAMPPAAGSQGDASSCVMAPAAPTTADAPVSQAVSSADSQAVLHPASVVSASSQLVALTAAGQQSGCPDHFSSLPTGTSFASPVKAQNTKQPGQAAVDLRSNTMRPAVVDALEDPGSAAVATTPYADINRPAPAVAATGAMNASVPAAQSASPAAANAASAISAVPDASSTAVAADEAALQAEGGLLRNTELAEAGQQLGEQNIDDVSPWDAESEAAWLRLAEASRIALVPFPQLDAPNARARAAWLVAVAAGTVCGLEEQGGEGTEADVNDAALVPAEEAAAAKSEAARAAWTVLHAPTCDEQDDTSTDKVAAVDLSKSYGQRLGTQSPPFAAAARGSSAMAIQDATPVGQAGAATPASQRTADTGDLQGSGVWGPTPAQAQAQQEEQQPVGVPRNPLLRSLTAFQRYLASKLQGAKSVFTIHNGAFQGLFSAESFSRLGLPDKALPQALAGSPHGSTSTGRHEGTRAIDAEDSGHASNTHTLQNGSADCSSSSSGNSSSADATSSPKTLPKGAAEARNTVDSNSPTRQQGAVGPAAAPVGNVQGSGAVTTAGWQGTPTAAAAATQGAAAAASLKTLEVAPAMTDAGITVAGVGPPQVGKAPATASQPPSEGPQHVDAPTGSAAAVALGVAGSDTAAHIAAGDGSAAQQALPVLPQPQPQPQQQVSWLKAALLSSDLVLTVSPAYAAQLIQRGPEAGGSAGGAAGRGGAEGGGNREDLRALLALRGVSGILNGIDVAAWHPGQDVFLPAEVRYDAASVATGKARAKALLQTLLGLDRRPDVPLFAFIGRLEDQKGADVVLAALPRLLGPPRYPIINTWLGNKPAAGRPSAPDDDSSDADRGGASRVVDKDSIEGCSAPKAEWPQQSQEMPVASLPPQAGGDVGLDGVQLPAAPAWSASAPLQVVMLGRGQSWLQACLEDLSGGWPGAALGLPFFSEPIGHLLMAAADFLVVPSRSEPCGLVALCALRYGTVPIVAPAGGLADVMLAAKSSAGQDDTAGTKGQSPVVGSSDGLVASPACLGGRLGYVMPEPVGPVGNNMAMRSAVEALVSCVEQACSDFESGEVAHLRQRGMAVDVSWEGAAVLWEQALVGLLDRDGDG